MIINLYIYAILITLTTLLLIWVLYKTGEELTDLKKTKESQMKYILNVCRGCGDYYDNQITQYEKQIYKDTDLINQLRKRKLEFKEKNDRW